MRYTQNLIREQKKAENLEKIRQQAFNKEVYRGKVTALASTLIMLAGKAVSQHSWGTTVHPTKIPSLKNKFVQYAELPPSYDTSRLSMDIWVDFGSNAEFKIGYDTPPHYEQKDDDEYVTIFRASNIGYMPTGGRTVIRPETGLAIQQPEDQKVVPVEFQSDEYVFIYHASALFMPQIVDLVEL